MIDLNKIFENFDEEEFDEEEFSEPEWKIINIDGENYIFINKIKKNGFFNYYTLKNRFLFKTKKIIKPLENIDENSYVIYEYNNNYFNRYKFKELPNNIRKKLGLKSL